MNIDTCKQNGKDLREKMGKGHWVVDYPVKTK